MASGVVGAAGLPEAAPRAPAFSHGHPRQPCRDSANELSAMTKHRMVLFISHSPF